jgi:hypothetical protein
LANFGNKYGTVRKTVGTVGTMGTKTNGEKT